MTGLHYKNIVHAWLDDWVKVQIKKVTPRVRIASFSCFQTQNSIYFSSRFVLSCYRLFALLSYGDAFSTYYLSEESGPQVVVSSWGSIVFREPSRSRITTTPTNLTHNFAVGISLLVYQFSFQLIGKLTV